MTCCGKAVTSRGRLLAKGFLGGAFVHNLTWGVPMRTVAGALVVALCGWIGCGGAGSPAGGGAGSSTGGSPGSPTGAVPGARHAVNVAISGSGSGVVRAAGFADCKDLCTSTAAEGTRVTFSALPAEGSIFAGWTRGCGGPGPCELLVSKDVEVSATFLLQPGAGKHALSVVKTGAGTVQSLPPGISCGSACGATFDGGVNVSLMPRPDPGWSFAGWGGACSGKGSCAVLANNDVSITATFARNDEGGGQAPPVAGGGDPGPWVPVGPGGGPVIQVAVDPADARVALAGGQSRMFRTTDGGLRWKDTGVVARLGVQSVAFSAAAPQRAWAVDYDGALFSSTDAGESWSGPERSLALLLPRWWVRLIPHPSEPGTLFAASGSGLFVSRDAGGSWALLWAPRGGYQTTPAGVCALAFDPVSPTTLFSGPCGYPNYGGVYRSTDAGATWTSLRTAWGEVTALATDPAKPGTVYAALDYGGLPTVVVSHDGGQGWTRENYASIPFAARTLSSTADGALYAGLSFKGIFLSRDDATTWTDAGRGIPAHSSASLAMHPQTREPYLAAIQGEFGGGGVYRASADGWRRSADGMFMETVSGLAFTRAGRLFASTDSGVFHSDDGGSSWTATALDQNTASLAIGPEDNLYVVDWQVLHRSDDGGRTWKDLQAPEGGAQLVADKQVPGRLYAYAYGLERSEDAGTSWRTLIRTGGISAFAVDPGQSLRLFAWSQGNARAPDGKWITVDPGLKRSEDGGATWTSGALGLPATPNCLGIVADGEHAGRVFVALSESGEGVRTSGVVYRSDDAGLSFRPVLRHDGELLQAIALGRDGALFAAFPGVVSRSDDGGATWRDVARGHPAIRALLPARDSGALYAATSAASVLRVGLRR
ncbi:MAG: hypothetical protein NVS2B9_05120 [Myxococcales bacterium]